MAIDVNNLRPAERVVLAVDTSDRGKAVDQMSMARAAGATSVKLGLELSTAKGVGGWEGLSEIAREQGLAWVADAKLHDIPNTVNGATVNLAGYDYPPLGITMHTTAGAAAMRRAQESAGDVTMFGVTVLTSMDGEECKEIFGRKPAWMVRLLARKAVDSGLRGLVASGREVGTIKSDPKTAGLTTLIPGTRSEWATAGDQKRVVTPFQAIADGADLLVIGRQVTGAKDPQTALRRTIEEIEAGLIEKRTRHE